MDSTTQSFGRHTHRIFEAIVIYEAFGRAIQAVQAGVDLIIDIDRESRRLEAVLDIDPTQSAEFVRELGRVSSETVTPFRDLVSTADQASAAFLDIDDPAARAAASLLLMENAGKLTTLTQRDMGMEVTNLIAIMKQLNIPVSQLGDFLGKIVVAGGNSSTIIAGLTDALQISSRAAAQAGVDLDTLLAIESEFLIQTGRTGTEVGNLFKLLFQRLSDPDVVSDVTKITNGLLQMRDATGAIRDPITIMLELNALLDAGVISVTQFKDVIDTLAPPLNPAAKADFILINELLGQIGGQVSAIGAADVTALDALVNKINDALGPQFTKLIIDAQRAFVDLFGPDIIQGGQALIAFIRDIAKSLKDVDPEIIKTIAYFGTFLAAAKLLTFALRGLAVVSGVAGVAGGIKLAATEARLAGAGFASMTSFVDGAKAAAIGLGRAIGPLLITVAAFMAIDFAGKVAEMQAALKQDVGTSLIGLDDAELAAKRERALSTLSPASRERFENPQTGGLRFSGFDPDLIQSIFVDPATIDLINEIDRLRTDIGPGAIVTVEDLGDEFLSTASDASQFNDAIRYTFVDEATRDAEEYANSLSGLSIEERLAADSAELFNTLAGAQADSLLELNSRFKDGTISQAEWNQGQIESNSAAQIASDLVAAYGDRLRTAIPELAGAAAGNEALAAALYDVLIQSSDGLPYIRAQADAAIALAGASTVAARGIALWAAANTALGATFVALREGSPKSFQFAAAQVAAIGRNAEAAVAGSLANILGAIRTSGSQSFGGGGGAAPKTPKAPKETGIFDINDLPTSELAKLIAIATTLRNKIPGETATSKDEIVALVKDAKFLQTVRGIDEKLLRLALEQLTKTLQEANDLAKAEKAILSNLQVNAGPLGALISAPTLFGAGGSIPAGLNFDPESPSPFTINIDIGNVTEMSPAQLQAAIEAAVRNAIIAGLRGQGSL